nr:polysaccharide deacetylase family protein [Candidatus Njordarchaeota archaeon]
MVSLSRMFSWGRHLKAQRSSRLFIHSMKMFRFHMTTFYQLLDRITRTLDMFDAKFTFPLVASTAQSHPTYVELMKSFPHEVAIHGYKHIKYQYLSRIQQEIEFKKAIQVFKNLKIPFEGFRAPYNNYNGTTKQLVEKYGFKWDIGIGYNEIYQNRYDFFEIKLENGEQSTYTCIPLNKWTDDLMVDEYGLSVREIARILISQLEKARKVKGIIMFELHPIRLGQKNIIPSLEMFLEHAHRIGAWVPTVSEAVRYWNIHHQWKDGAPVCCLLTGDIDNFTFWDYLRRF